MYLTLNYTVHMRVDCGLTYTYYEVGSQNILAIKSGTVMEGVEWQRTIQTAYTAPLVLM